MIARQESRFNSHVVLEALVKVYESREYYNLREIAELSGLDYRHTANGVRVLWRRGNALVRVSLSKHNSFRYRASQDAVLTYRAERSRPSQKPKTPSLPPVTRYYVNPLALRAGVPVEQLKRDRLEVYTPSWEVA